MLSPSVKRFLLPLLALTALAARAEAGTVESPLAMAATLEARMAAGDGVTLPDPATEIVRHAGTIDLARGDWPAAVRARAGETICVAVSPFTGNYEFFDESGERFFTLVPVLPTTENWVAPFRHAEDGTFPDDALYAPWRLVDVWSLTHAESAEFAEFVSHAENAESLVARRSSLVTRGAACPATNLCFTAFAFSETNLYFTAAWPTNKTLPVATLDLYGSTNLLDPRWMFLSSHTATTNPVSFAIARGSLPWYVAPTQHVHDASCESITNIVLSPLDGASVYTNVFWSCSTNLMPGEAGFFRLGTRHDSDGDGLFDAAELLVHGTRPDRLDSDGDGVPDGIEPSVWWSNPLWATNSLDTDFIVDIVAPSDGSEETVLTLDGLRIPLSPAAGSWCFSLPHGQVVSCSASSSSPFFILWCGSFGGSFWNEPNSFETPFWTDGIESVAGYHTVGGSCQLAVPVLTIEPDFGGGLRSGGSANASHIGPDGSVCVHAADGIQRYAWSVAPAVAVAGRTPFATGAVQLESGNPFIDVSGTSGIPLSGTFGFGPGTTNGAVGTLWGSLTNVLSAHRCDATLTSPCCSVCGEYETFDGYILSIALEVSKTLLTLKHDNQATISISRFGPWGENPPEGTVEIRRSGAANEWLTLGVESDLAPWTARIAGHFDLRGIVPCGGFSVTTAVQQIEVQFPSGAQIAADEEFISSAEWAWTLMTSEASEPPHAQREYGFCVFLDTFDQEYDCSDIQQGPFIPPYGNGEIAVDCDPVTDPYSPSPTASGARYAVATFHTHPPAAYAFEGWYRPTGPSSNDVSNAMTRGLPSMVSDYIPFEGDNGKINGGHPLDAEHQRILIPNPVRRATP